MIKRIGAVLLTLLVIFITVYIFFPQVLLKGIYKYELAKGDFATEYIELNGQKFYYLDNNREGKKTIVFLHGYTDKKASWVSFVTPLTKEYRIVIPDLLGHGDNPLDFNISHDFVTQADFVNDFTDALSLNYFHLVGISMGGAVSGNFAAKYPDKVETLSLISTAGINGYARLSKIDSLMLSIPTLDEKIDKIPLLPHEITKTSVEDFKKYLFYQDLFTPVHFFKIYLNHVVVNREFYVKVLQDFMDADTRQFKNPLNGVLAEIKCPVNVIWGKQDPLLDVTCVDVIKSGLPKTPIVTIIDECGHGTIAEKPEETMEALRKILD